MNFKKYYSNNHLFIIGMVIIGLIYTQYLDKKYLETIQTGVKSSHRVVKQNCRYSPKSQSSVTVHVGNQDYIIALSSSVCENFPVNSVISVYYLEKYDEYMYKRIEYKSNMVFILILLFLSLLPWSYVFNIFYSKYALKK